MFCIPYGEVRLTNSKVNNFVAVDMNKSLAMSLAQGIARSLTDRIIDYSFYIQ